MADNSSLVSESAADELTFAIGQYIRRLRVETASTDLNLSQMNVLARLEKDGWMITSDLARSASMKPQSMGTILAFLEKRGLVMRRPHATDGRQVEFYLTDEGKAARSKRSVAKRAWLSRAFAGLTTDERRDLARAAVLIRRIAEE